VKTVRLGLIALAVAGLVLAAGLESAPAKGPFHCPALSIPVADQSQEATPEEVLRVARRLVPREYAALSSMGDPAWQHFQVRGIVSLEFRQNSSHLVDLAQRLCGGNVTRASWAVQLFFPNCQLPCAFDDALLVRTRAGWRIWYSEFRRP
jgi:hypothetical protein